MKKEKASLGLQREKLFKAQNWNYEKKEKFVCSLSALEVVGNRKRFNFRSSKLISTVVTKS